MLFSQVYLVENQHTKITPTLKNSLAKSPILCFFETFFERFNSSNSIEFCAKNSAIIKIKINSENL